MSDRISAWQPKTWRLLRDAETNANVKAGATVYDLKGWDYGCSSDDTRILGIEYKAVTLDPDGDYPFFTVPKRDLQPIEQQP